jgi:hypothetical protein
MTYQTPMPQSYFSEVYDDHSLVPPFRTQDGCLHIILVPSDALIGNISERMCAPQILHFMGCGHFEEYHCTVGRSFQAGEVHPFCSFNKPALIIDLDLIGFCSDCALVIREHKLLVVASAKADSASLPRSRGSGSASLASSS